MKCSHSALLHFDQPKRVVLTQMSKSPIVDCIPMKKLTILEIFACIAIFACVINAQQAAATTDSYVLGSRTIRIPAPHGFVDVVPRFDQITARFIATESPNNDMLAVHVENSMAPTLQKGESPALDFYTKVSVSKRFKTVDISVADFKAMVVSFEKESPSLLDSNGPVMKAIVQHSNKGLSELSGTKVEIEMDQPTNLGYFDKRSDIYSAMILFKLKDPQMPLPMLCGISYVRVNSRLLFVYTYRKFTSERDVDALRDFTKKWTAAIIAANK